LGDDVATRDSRPRQTVDFDVVVPVVQAEPPPGGVLRDRLLPLLKRYVMHTDRTPNEEAAFLAWSRGVLGNFLRVFAVAFLAMVIATWPGDLRFRGADQAIFDAFVVWRASAVVLFVAMFVSYWIPVLRRHPLVPLMTVYVAIVAVVGYAMGRIGGLDSPWFYALYGSSWLTIVLPVGVGARVLTSFAVALAGAIGYFVPFPEHFAHRHVEVPLINLASFSAVGVLVGHVIHHLMRDNYFAHREAEAERARAQQLLHNMLPETIATRLQRNPGPLGDRFENVTVLFADIVDFTGLSGRIAPERLVRFLNDLFTQFDLIAHRHGLEKIKTVGDGYMVAGGLPEPRDDHPVAVAEMALELIATAATIKNPEGAPVRLRIGMQTGPVVAGVIGVQKLTYDLWGDTVNVASRLESHGVPGYAQVGEACYQRLRDHYRFQPRGAVELKGVGEVPVYLLLGR
jgi:class 3 adenylate cyclase